MSDVVGDPRLLQGTEAEAPTIQNCHVTDYVEGISQHQGLGISAEFTPEALHEFIEATRVMDGPSRMDMSQLPRWLDD